MELSQLGYSLPKVIVVEKYACNECGQVYDNFRQAFLCETDPVPPTKVIVNNGDKFVEGIFIAAVSGMWEKAIRPEVTRNIDEVPFLEVVGVSHQAIRRGEHWYRSPVYILSDGLETVRINALILGSSFQLLTYDQRDKIVRNTAGVRSIKWMEKQQLGRIEAVVDELLLRANIV